MTNSETYTKVVKGIQGTTLGCQVALTLEGVFIITGEFKETAFFDELFDTIFEQGVHYSQIKIAHGAGNVKGSIMLAKTLNGGPQHG